MIKVKFHVLSNRFAVMTIVMIARKKNDISVNSCNNRFRRYLATI